MYKKEIKGSDYNSVSLNNINLLNNDNKILVNSNNKLSTSNNSTNNTTNIINNNNNGNKNSKSFNMKKSGSRNRSLHSHSKRHNNSSLDSSNNNNNKQLIDDSDDLLSIIKHSKNKIDISHLLTYNYTTDQNNNNNNNRSQRQNLNFKNKDKNKNNNKNKKKSLNYDIHLSGLSYINANYKFILKPDGDYKPQLLDPNLPLNINDIARVVIKQNDYHCPICMGDEFAAPRMTKCGHIFCYPCLLSMFDNVKNDKSKTSIGNLHNPIIFCPLCSEVIKERFILLPVLIESVNDLNSKIKINSNILLTLMYRGNSKIYSQPVSNFFKSFKGFNGNIPWISENSSPINFSKFSPYISNSRLLISDFKFIKSCYEKEIDDLMTQKLLDFELYGDLGKFYQLAINNIKKEILLINEIINDLNNPIKIGPKPIEFENLSYLNLNFDNKLPSFKDGFYYYQYNLNSRIHYFLSPLDVLIINLLFKIPKEKENNFEINPAINLPLNLKVFIENINSDENKVSPELVEKYPFLGNLPYGAEIGFLEIDWTKFDSSIIPINDENEKIEKEENENDDYPNQIPKNLKKKLENRTKEIKKKRNYEERARVRGELRREKETLEIFNNDNKNEIRGNEKDNNDSNDDNEYSDEFFYNSNRWNKNQFVHIDNFNDMPVLKGISNKFDRLRIDNENNMNTDGSNSIVNQSITIKKSVWGTDVPVVIDPEEEALREEESKQFEELLKKAKDEAIESGKKGKKGKKRVKMIPLPL